MKLFSEGKNYKLYQGSMLDMLEVIEPNSVDSIVTDPPYELGFMNKGWDASGIAFQKETWGKCYTVLKSGGYLLAFGGTRTFHRIACAIEDAGFEIRDTIMWLYGSGFPKSMNIGKAVESKLVNGSANKQDFKDLKGTKVESGDWGISRMVYEQGARPNDYTADGHLRVDKVDYQTEEGKKWDGYGTTLKPAYEPIIIARKPCEGSCVDNVLKYGVGGINIDEGRVGVEERTYKGAGSSPQKINNHEKGDTGIGMLDGSGKDLEFTVNGRFPSNVILTYDETDKDEVCGGMPDSGSGNNGTPYNYAGREYDNKDSSMFNGDKPRAPSNYNDNGSAARYFYCAKATQKDRDEGLEGFETKKTGELQGGRQEGSAGSIMQNVDGTTRVNPYAGTGAPKKNTHPTVKPCELMQYLVRLVTPKGGTVLDPFNGSGSTGKACMYENRERGANYKYIGIELTPEYLPISDARISCIANQMKKRRLI